VNDLQAVTMREGFDLLYAPGSYLGRTVAGGVYEPEQTALVRMAVAPGWLFVDAGAGIGYYTMLAAKLGCQVVAFEPSSNHAIISAALRRNKLHATVISAAVGDTNGDGTLYLNAGNDGDNRTTAGAGEWSAEPVRVLTLDSLGLAPAGPVLLKVDVQGSELAVLRGAAEFLARCRPTMLIEDSPVHLPMAGETETLRDVLTGLDYDWRVVDQRTGFCDLFCVPREA
jgi:FkbM family methyltransferase